MKESKARATARIGRIAEALRHRYPEAECALRYGGDPWRLLVMGRLSAQCTDARVNEVSLPLFAAYPTVTAMAEADLAALEEIVRPCGLFRTKARDLVASARMLLSDFGGELPDTMEELLRLPGVGRKIANLLLGDIFGKGGVVADTHCIRIAGRLGFTPEERRDPLVCERTLTPLLLAAGESPADFCHRIVLFGREICTARSPACAACPLAAEGLCPKGGRSE